MPTLNSKEFGEILIKLEKIADGIDMHKAEEGFVIPSSDTIREKKSQLEQTRQEYEFAANSVKIKYDSYSEQLQEVKLLLENTSSLISGFYGKRNQILGDFGISPLKSVRKKSNSVNEETVGSN